MARGPKPAVVLLVEDEWLVRMEMADALSEAGWAVVEAGSGAEAIALIGETEPDLLVTDIRLLDGVSGWDVADAFRAALPGRPIVYASANPMNAERRAPDSIFLAKPARTERLIETCRRLLAKDE